MRKKWDNREVLYAERKRQRERRELREKDKW